MRHIAIALALLLASPVLFSRSAKTAAVGATAPIAPPTGSLLGAFVNPNGAGQTDTSVTALAARLKRQLDLDRVYAGWDATQPVAQVKWDVSNGITPLLSIDPFDNTGAPIPWAAIAAGKYDATIISQADALAALNAPIILSFSHEPELDTANGTAAQFVAAWQHYVDVFRSMGETNISFAPILVAGTYSSSAISSWYPGDAYVDWVATDGYNDFGCRHDAPVWRSFSAIFSGFENFAVAHDKPAVIAEWASAEDPQAPGLKAEWIAAAAATIESWPQVKGSLYFDAPGATPTCGWPLSTSASATSAFATLASQSWFNSRPYAVLSGSVTSGPAPLDVQFDTTGSEGILRPISQWTLDFGDGTTPTSGSGTPPASIAHDYLAGTYTATLTVFDSSDDSGSMAVSIESHPPPAVQAGKAPASATVIFLGGSVTPGGIDTRYQFQWGTSPKYGNSSPVTEAGAANAAEPVYFTVTGLRPSTQYYWRLLATNLGGTSATAPQMATTRAS